MENIIKLLGYCIHREEKLTVYELEEDISLNTFIGGGRQKTTTPAPNMASAVCNHKGDYSRSCLCASRLRTFNCSQQLKVVPGEVDYDLEGEVAKECTKFGTVTRVLIFEITEPNSVRESRTSN